MKQTEKTRVEFTRENAAQCICGECPVQSKSACARANLARMGDVMKAAVFEPAVISALYCAGGTASCKDLDFKQTCICGGCPVYERFNLGTGQPDGYYCSEGLAR